MSAGVVLSKELFLPNERVTGHVYWDLERAPRWLEVRLVWHTEGKGTSEYVTIGRERLRDLAAQDRRDFSFTLPDMPYTYHGRIVSILWSVDLVGPGRRIWRREDRVATTSLVMSPTLRPYGVPA